jgi:alpha-L-fucosidase
LQVYGESIYGTKAGYLKPQDWGCITQKGNKMYIHVLKNAETTINLPKFPNEKIIKAYLLKNNSAVKAN